MVVIIGILGVFGCLHVHERSPILGYEKETWNIKPIYSSHAESIGTSSECRIGRNLSVGTPNEHEVRSQLTNGVTLLHDSIQIPTRWTLWMINEEYPRPTRCFYFMETLFVSSPLELTVTSNND